MRIYKYDLDIATDQIIEMPINSVILSAGSQNERLKIWAKVDENSFLVKRKFYVYGTGMLIPDDLNAEFIGTVQVASLVLHVYISNIVTTIR